MSPLSFSSQFDGWTATAQQLKLPVPKKDKFVGVELLSGEYLFYRPAGFSGANAAEYFMEQRRFCIQCHESALDDSTEEFYGIVSDKQSPHTRQVTVAERLLIECVKSIDFEGGWHRTDNTPWCQTLCAYMQYGVERIALVQYIPDSCSGPLEVTVSDPKYGIPSGAAPLFVRPLL